MDHQQEHVQAPAAAAAAANPIAIMELSLIDLGSFQEADSIL